MRPIGREGGDGRAQGGRSLISTVALLCSCAAVDKSSTDRACCSPSVIAELLVVFMKECFISLSVSRISKKIMDEWFEVLRRSSV